MLFTTLRKRGQTIAEILIAYSFIGLLLGMRCILDRRHMPSFQIDRFSPQLAMILNNSMHNVVYYHPLMPRSPESFSSLSNTDLLAVHAYIIFTNMDSCVNQSTMPDQVQYTLRMQENDLYYYRVNHIKLLDSVIRTKRAPEDFCQTLLAKIVGFILWFFTFVDFYTSLPVGVLYVLCFFPNIGIMICVQVLLQYERKCVATITYSELYSNLFTYPLYIGICLLLMLVYSIIYMLLAIYIERINPGSFGISQPWNYLCKIGYWKSRSSSCIKHINISKTQRKNEPIIEKNHWIESNALARAKLPILSIHNMTKKFGKLDAVKNLSLDFYNGEVFSLLGHNGAGKTTTTFILVGTYLSMLQPTSGSITVEGLDGQINIQEVRKMIGFCPQYDILYDQLTVREHLTLVSEMRQIRRKDVNQSIDYILDLIGLVDHQHTWAKNLSGGMKRRLSIGISLVGDSKVLILDEPTSGIDPYNRRLIWTIIRKMKEAGKCIIMTTHFLEEADVLSDRIAVMTKGRLQASGTPAFLKQQTEFEYRVFIEKKSTCDIERVTELFHKHVQTAILERQSSSELVFGIKRGMSQQISRLIKALDEEGPTINIDGYGLSMTTVEEVFLKLVEEDEEEEYNEANKTKHEHEKPKSDLANTGMHILNEQKTHPIHLILFFITTVFQRKPSRVTGCFLVWFRLFTLIIKRWILSRRQILVLIGFFLGPLVIEILSISTLPSPQAIQGSLLQNERVENAEVTLLPSIYNPHTIVINSNDAENKMQGYLTNYLTEMGANLDVINTSNITDYVLSRNQVSYDVYVNKYQMGFAISRNIQLFTFNVFFSTVNYHAMATSLSVATTSLFQYYANSSLRHIETINQPFSTVSNSVTPRTIFYDQIYCFDTIPLSLLNFINSIIAAIFISILALNIIRERIRHSKDLQLLTNTSKKLYWLSNFIYDLALCLILSALLTIAVKIGSAANPDPNVEVKIYQGTAQIGYFFLLYVMFSLASLPFMYSYSFIPQSELIGFIMFLMLNALVCFIDMVFGFIALFSQASPSASLTEIGTTARSMLILRALLAGIFPTINFKQALYNIRLRSDPNCISAINAILITNYSPDVPWASLNEPGIGLQLVIFAGQMVLWWIFLACIENRTSMRKYVCCCFNRKKRNATNRKKEQAYSSDSTDALEWDDSKLDKDVRDERRMVHANRDSFTSNVVLVRDLVQRFRKRKGKSILRSYSTTVDHLNFYVPKQACFGLLGANGAGKTTTFRMLINAIQPNAGEIIINGKNINETHGDIDMGFCPQFDWLIDDLNVVETLTLFARLKGLSSSIIPTICDDMIQLFGLEHYREREVQNLSGGNKRKVSAAVAFMANPSLVFLDEPTTGLDAGAKRKLWSVIRAARDAGLTIIMTSHSMEECEALCTKIGIMKSGQFICLGSLQHLKTRFGKGYAVRIKVPAERMSEFQQEIKTTLPGVKIQGTYGILFLLIKFFFPPIDEQNGVLFCNAPLSSNLSLVFEVLNTKKEQNIIENYSVNQTTLEQIFVRLAGHDVNDDDNLAEADCIPPQLAFNATNAKPGMFVPRINATKSPTRAIYFDTVLKFNGEIYKYNER
ncbi:unnamed protein product [Rotaria socialis]|uniref:ABC transporter domain-containing protein n=1 Tax=Rotaria socialis TaxID=392032 RepID=A0A818FSW5_9BILA|nr:unnamed protein product [Rotaria socialis]